MSLRNSKHALNNFNVIRGPQHIPTQLYRRLQNISAASSLSDNSSSEGEQGQNKDLQQTSSTIWR
jgi:hypothetical protein